MTIPATGMPRVAVSPYARRLARERGVSLTELRGSGPRGRVLAADIAAYTPTKASQTELAKANATQSTATQASTAPQTSAFATTIGLRALHDLMAQLKAAGGDFELIDLLMRAAGLAFSKSESDGIALEIGRRQAVFQGFGSRSLSSFRTHRLAVIAQDADHGTEPAILSLRLVSHHSIRPIAMPLLSTRPMRLVISAEQDREHAECLLTFDAAVVDDEDAAMRLDTLRSSIETPLRLFV